ncbi:MAG: hypothetical protein Q9M26_04135 [Mariprofundales bacterium]|nr:hypothetical protein [Mariprofundales bacterium]
MTTNGLDFHQLPVVPMDGQQVCCEAFDFAGAQHPGASFRDFLCGLPNLGSAADLVRVRDALVAARRGGHGRLLACGGGLIDRGLGPMVAQSMAYKIFSSLALTGSAMLKDVEVALSGKVFAEDGQHGVTEESCRLIVEAIDWAAEESIGLGASVGQRLLDVDAPHREHSLLAVAAERGVPVTVHPAIGADAFHRHPALRGESMGAAGLHDFRLLAALVGQCSHGVVLNVASSVVMPRLLAEASAAVRSTGATLAGVRVCMVDGAPVDGVARQSLARVAVDTDAVCTMTGAVELLLPLLLAAVVDTLEE